MLRCNAALLALKALTLTCTKHKQKDFIFWLSAWALLCWNITHKTTYLPLSSWREKVFPHFATSCCWEKPPAIPGIKFFCTGTVVLLYRYLILQGTRNFPRISNKLFLASGVTRYSYFCLLVWIDLQKAFEGLFLKSSELPPHTQWVWAWDLGTVNLSTLFSQRTWLAVKQMPHFGIPMLCLCALISFN